MAIDKILAGIDKLLLTLSTNKKAGRWFIVLVAISMASVIIGSRYLFPGKKVEVDKPGQCDFVMDQNKQLINALLEIKQNLKTLTPNTSVSYIDDGDNYFMYASIIDTVPRKVSTKNQYQQMVNRVLFKIDSILIKQRFDSLRRIEQSKKKAT